MNLKELSKKWHSAEEIKKILEESTIFDKIEFSEITKDQIKEQLLFLDIKVSKREVFLEKSDREVKFYWFKNWLHPKLKHFVKRKRITHDWGPVSSKDRENIYKLEYLYQYENGQQNFNYTLEEIEKYIKGE